METKTVMFFVIIVIIFCHDHFFPNIAALN